MTSSKPNTVAGAYAASLLKLPVNTAGRDWFVGDLHGELHLLERFFENVGFDTGRDRVICTGDLVDRGPDSAAVLKLFDDSSGWFYSVLGNHDALMRESLIGDSHDARRLWRRNGGKWAAALTDDRRMELAQTLQRLPLAIEVPLPDGRRVGVVHADLPSWLPWAEIGSIRPNVADAIEAPHSNSRQLLWSRRRAKQAMALRDQPEPTTVSPAARLKALKMLAPAPGIDLLVMGHTVLQPALPLRVENFLWIDTGAGYAHGRLTAIDLVRGECRQVAHGKGIHRIAVPEPIGLGGWQLAWDEIPAAAGVEQRPARERTAVTEEIVVAS